MPIKPKDSKTPTDPDEPTDSARKIVNNPQVIPRNTDSQSVIPVNVAEKCAKNQLMRCTVSIKHLNEHTSTNTMGQINKTSADLSGSASKAGYSMRACQPPKKVTHRTSGCKRLHVDYTQYDTSTDPPSPPKGTGRLTSKENHLEYAW